MLAEFDAVVGLDRLHAIHMNDTKNPCGTRKDRHDKLGEGYIGPDAFQELLNHPKLRHLPFYLETPNEIDGYTRELVPGIIRLRKPQNRYRNTDRHMPERIRYGKTESKGI